MEDSYNTLYVSKTWRGCCDICMGAVVVWTGAVLMKGGLYSVGITPYCPCRKCPLSFVLFLGGL